MEIEREERRERVSERERPPHTKSKSGMRKLGMSSKLACVDAILKRI